MEQTTTYTLDGFPFLNAISWQVEDLSVYNDDEILNLYERGWIYKGILAELSIHESAFLKKLAKAKRSWLVNEL